MTPNQMVKILDGQLKDCHADIEAKTARIAELEAALNAARSDALQEAAAICTAVFKESAGYNLPQMALGASKCGDDILALEANT
jgi:hypothetical protein